MSAILAVVGLAREARIARGAGLKPVIGSGDSALLARRLEEAGGDIKAVVSFGIAGALAPLLRTGDIVIAENVVTETERFVCDEAWTEALLAKLPRARRASIAGSDFIAAHLNAKKTLFAKTGGHAVDMESHIAARFAKSRGLPFAVLRAISDASHRALPPAALEPLKPSGKPRLAAVLKSLADDPAQIAELLQTGREADRAMNALLRCRHVLGSGLGCPYLG
jgi:adenosylhomocysteine nucleosidase